jgi:hypothetical protein
MESLWLLAVLACPLGMGLMMYFMMRGKGGQLPPADRADEERRDAG